ncbi:hypothetical protein JD844_010108, partial [Phrynosoma platyrhinos]
MDSILNFVMNILLFCPAFAHGNQLVFDISGDKDGSKVTTVVATPGQGPDRPQEVSYTDTKVIGNGSFGVVYQAKLCDSGELVAIKKVLQDKRFKVSKSRQFLILTSSGSILAQPTIERTLALQEILSVIHEEPALSGNQPVQSILKQPSQTASFSQIELLAESQALQLLFLTTLSLEIGLDVDIILIMEISTAVLKGIQEPLSSGFGPDTKVEFGTLLGPALWEALKPMAVCDLKLLFWKIAFLIANRELQIMRKLDHCNIVRLRYFFYSSGEKKDEVYLNLVLDYVPETVYRVARHYSRAKQTLPMIFVKLYMYQLFRSLAYIHSFGICHRDIKPQNLLLDPDTAVLKLCDFGSAKQLVRGEPNVSYICSRYYRAPELIFGATDYTSSIGLPSSMVVEAYHDKPLHTTKVLGTPTREQIREMNPNYTEFKFPQIKAHPWTKVSLLEIMDSSGTGHFTSGVRVFRPRTPPEAIALCSRLLEYTPTARLTPLEACAHSFFDELRDPNIKLPSGREKPALFNFTTQELSSNPSLASTLIPAHARNQAAASTPTNTPAASGGEEEHGEVLKYAGLPKGNVGD